MVRRQTALVLGALALVLAAGCSGDGDGEPEAEPSATVTTLTPSTPPAVQTKVGAGRLHGFMTAQERARAVTNAGAVVDSWVEAAWVSGPWPRTVDGAWGAFTPGAAQLAQRDAALTSAAGFSEQVSAVRVTRRDIAVDLLAKQGTPAGATARLALDLEVTPSAPGSVGTASASPSESGTASPAAPAPRTVTVRGRVMLTPTATGWKIFGHDLTRGGW